MAAVHSLGRDECLGLISAEEVANRSACTAVWDGLMCWPSAAAGSTLSAPCPSHPLANQEGALPPQHLGAFATKVCTADASWYFNEYMNRTWTNYSLCRLSPDAKDSNLYEIWLPVFKVITYVGYTLSITTLLTGLAVFSIIKKLQTCRNRLHMHLMLSFIFKAVMHIVRDVAGLKSAEKWLDVELDNGLHYVTTSRTWICKVITITAEYSIIANYMLILMEGIYLHNLLFISFFSENSETKVYAASGWSLPFVVLLPWITLRLLYEDVLCWTTHEKKSIVLFLHIPIISSLLINFVLFIKILKILFIKLSSIYIQRRKTKYRKLIRSTLILLPFYGIPYSMFLILWFYADTSTIIELIWIFCDQTFASFQGFLVALLYCLLTDDVRWELKRRYHLWRYRRQFNATLYHTSFRQERPTQTA